MGLVMDVNEMTTFYFCIYIHVFTAGGEVEELKWLPRPALVADHAPTTLLRIVCTWAFHLGDHDIF